jgi:hypothetical protein
MRYSPYLTTLFDTRFGYKAAQDAESHLNFAADFMQDFVSGYFHGGGKPRL